MHKETELVLVHGWGCNSSVWQDWHLSSLQRYRTSIFDRGYFGASQTIEQNKQENTSRIVIAHSLGVHFLDREYLKTIDMLVLISSFSHFHLLGESQSTKTATKAMRSKLHKFPNKVLQDFYQSCGQTTSNISDIYYDRDLLVHDLVLLDESHLLDSLNLINNILLLHGQEDKISPPKQSMLLLQSLPQAVLEYHPIAEHALPITHRAWCLEVIDRYIHKHNMHMEQPAYFYVQP